MARYTKNTKEDALVMAQDNVSYVETMDPPAAIIV